MEGQAEDDLKGATYYVNFTTEEGVFYADPRTVEAVIRDLLPTFQALTSGGDSSPSDPRLPESFASKSKSYGPLAHLLNKIIATAQPYIPQSLLRDLHFHPFGDEVKELHDDRLKRPKPRAVGLIGMLPAVPNESLEGPAEERAENPKLSWEQVEVIFISRATVRGMVWKSGTYARGCILSNQRRFFSLGIGFQYTNLEAYVFAFHHGGLSSSRPLKITTEEGFNELVRHIVGVLSIKDEPDYGLDPTRSGDLFFINDRCYKSVRYIFVCGNLPGRSTIIHSLEAVNDIQSHSMKSRRLTLSSGIQTLPDELTYKLAYQVKGKSREGPLFSQFHGQFGIADVIGYHICGPEDPHGSTSRLFNNAQYWNVSEERSLPEGNHPSPEPPEPEDRGLQCIAFSGKGKALLDVKAEGGIPSPGELLETILHAIMGHYNLFDKGVLHRDVSSGNVLRYAEPIERPAIDEFDCTKNVNFCRGFLIDGDHAVKWRESSTSQSLSGTRPFMSMRLLNASEYRDEIIQTALDDLESFLWLLVWGIVNALNATPGANDANKGLKRMTQVFSGGLESYKNKFTTAKLYWKDAVFGDLIKEWLNVVEKTHEANVEFTEDMAAMKLGSGEWGKKCAEVERYCKKIYKKILESGFKHLNDVKKYIDWNRVVAANYRKSHRRQFSKEEGPEQAGDPEQTSVE